MHENAITVSRLISSLPDLSMPQQTWLEQQLRDLSAKLATLQDGQASIRERLSMIEVEMKAHNKWADAQADRIEVLENKEEETTSNLKAMTLRFDWWAWLVGGVGVGIGVAVSMAFDWLKG